MAESYDPLAKPEYFCETSRYRRLNQLQLIYDGKQYDGRPNWWTGFRPGDHSGDRAPLRERKPCIVYRLPKAAVEQVVRFLFGEGRFPSVKVPGVDTDGSVGGVAISPDDAETLGTWLAEFIERSQLKPVARSLARTGISTTAAVAVLGLREGEFRFETPRPHDCWPQFVNDDPAGDVARLVWCYKFEKTVTGPDGKPQVKDHFFRRDWDGTNHYVYKDVEIEPGKVIQWPAPTVTAHGFSFCPVIWVRNEPENAKGIDGVGLYEGLEQDFEALDFTMSQRHRGLTYLGTPQPYETGVKEGDGPDETGRKAGPVGFSGDAPHGAVMPVARRMAPDEIWTYEGEQVNVALLETSGKAFEVATNHVNDIRSRALETMGVVLTSMADTVNRVSAGAEMSAKFLALAHAPLLGLVSEYRQAWWPHCLVKIVSMAMRMLAELDGKQTVLIPGSDKAAKILAPFLSIDVGGGEKRWVPPKLEPLWGNFFDPSSMEIKQAVEAANAAKDGGLISTETGTRYVADDFGVVDIVAELETVAVETEERQALELEKTAAENEILHQMAGGADDEKPAGDKPASGKKPPKPGKGGSRSSAAAKAKKPSSA